MLFAIVRDPPTGVYAMSTPSCSVAHEGGRLFLWSPLLTLTLDTADGLRAISLENRLAGKTLRLDGPEFEVDLDAAERRLWIAGWRCQPGDDGAVPSDEEAGYRAGYHLPGADDSNWSVHETPNRSWGSIRSRLVWSRTQLFLPGGSRTAKRGTCTAGTPTRRS